jgi:hypothetical protein
MPGAFHEFPKWKYNATEEARIVTSRSEELALGPGWVDRPDLVHSIESKPVELRQAAETAGAKRHTSQSPELYQRERVLAGLPMRRLRAVRCHVPVIERPEPIDWPAIIAELQRQGASLRQIGGAIGVSHNTVTCWQQRRSRGTASIPNHADGEALLELHAILCGDEVE